MATHTHKSAPLRDRLLSNSPDPIKSSILRESGMGWASSQPGSMSSTSSSSSVTSPLRIAKRDSPVIQRGAGVVRRSSSSFKHVRNNNLVSKSPFKTQPPASSTPPRPPLPIMFPTRRVSGEKRPRPSSMHEEAEHENDRPFALKRDRKQSKTFQGLLEKEPVTKSPFKKRERMSGVDEPIASSSKPSPPPINAAHITTINSQLAVPDQSSPALSTGSSPRKSSLKPRLRGARLSGGRKEPKAVIFEERCEVLEYDLYTSDEEFWEESDDGGHYPEHYHDADDGDAFFGGEQAADEPLSEEVGHQLAPDVSMAEEDSYESMQLTATTGSRNLLDTDVSINGLVDEIFFSNSPNHVDTLESTTPPRILDLPTDLETEDGVPFVPSPHVERLLQQHEHYSPQHNQPLPHLSPRASPQIQQAPIVRQPSQDNNELPYPYNLGLPTHASPHGPPATPPPRLASGLIHSTPPVGRPMPNEETLDSLREGREANVEKFSMSLSPRNSSSTVMTRGEGSIPKFKWPRGSPYTERRSPSVHLDGIDHRRELSFEEHYKSSNDSLDPANLSIGNSEVSLSGLARGDIYHSEDEGPPESVMDHSSSLKDDTKQEDPTSFIASNTSQEEEDEEILAAVNDGNSRRGSSGPSPRTELPSRFTSPSIPSASPLNLSQGSITSRAMSPRPNMRHRISKDDIMRRLTERRSTPSPTPEPTSQFNSTNEEMEFLPTPELDPVTKDNERLSPELSAPAVPQALHTDDLDYEKEQNRMSVLTDISIEPATVQHAEKFNVTHALPPTPDSLSEKDFGMLSAGSDFQVNFGSKFSLGGLGLDNNKNSSNNKNNRDDDPLRMQSREEHLGVVPRQDEADSSSINSGASIKVGDVDVSMDMKSALDRLMDDVAGAGGREDEDSTMTDESEESYDQSLETNRPNKIQKASTDTELLYSNVEVPRRGLVEPSTSSRPPPPPPKDNIKAREQLILEKRREARRAEEGDAIPTRSNGQKLQAQLGLGRPSRRRSMSAGDAQDLAKKGVDNKLLSIGEMEKLEEEDPLSQSIERELKKLESDEGGAEKKKSKYQIREHEGTIYASALDDKVSHMDGAGDLDSGKAWRTVRRPSDMDEYSKQIKEYRSQANPAKAYGKVFVKVLGIKVANIPLPQQATAVACTLNNGIHFVTTPECELSPDCRIDQEFELIEHSKLEFTLTLKITRDPHIIAQFKALTPSPTPPPPPPPVVVQQSTSRGMRSFWSSPKKPSKQKPVQTPPPPPPPVHRLPENLARYLKPDGTLARAFIQFKDIATRCNTRLFETSYPLIGQRVELGGKFSTMQVGEICLQMFRLPPLPGIPPDQMPQSLEECHRGLRHINWHKMTYFQGALTQSGGDCSTRRRRLFRVIGAKLVAFSDITKKATATIDLKKAIAVQDDQDLRNPLTPLARSRGFDEDDVFGLQRSFRLIFPQDQEIIFFADTDEEKYRWLEVLRALVGHIPPHPLWAELLWQRQEESSKRTSSQAPAGQATVGIEQQQP